jgi:hypothetical protein
MFKTVAAQAALRAYTDAIAAGAAADVSISVALARYRSFYPLAAEHTIRSVVARALAFERLRKQGAVFRTEDIREQEARLRVDMTPPRLAAPAQPS